MTATRTGALSVEVDKLRIGADDAARIGAAITGMTMSEALDATRFRPATRSAEIAAVLDRAVTAAREEGRDPAALVIESVRVAEGEAITRLRRMAHGVADWITTPTLRVTVTVSPVTGGGCGAGAIAAPTPVVIGRRREPAANPNVAALRDTSGDHPVMAALARVIDPDLGVNIVDLGFIRGWELSERAIGLVVTLTNPFCPLTTVIEDQIRFELRMTGLVDHIDIEWTFTPPWSPDDVSGTGRGELRAIGFSTV